MSGDNALISHSGTRHIARSAGPCGCSTARPISNPRPPAAASPTSPCRGVTRFEAGHIPGADFLDLQGEFSDPDTALHFMMPAVAQLEAAFGRHGVSADSQVVLYSIGTPMWATRFWWMLQSLGFENAAVLDGGLDKWKAEGRAIETGPAKGYKPATFTAKPKAGYFVGKHDVLAAKERAQHRRRQRARPAIPQGPGAEPLRPAGARARQLQRFRRQRCSIRRPRPSFRSPKPKRNSPRRASPKTSA